MDMTLSDEHVAVRALAAEFVDREVRPRAAEWDRAEAVDTGIVAKLGGRARGARPRRLVRSRHRAGLAGPGNRVHQGVRLAGPMTVAAPPVFRGSVGLLRFDRAGYGYIDEYPVGKYLRDAPVATLYEGTSQIQQLVIGRALTGVNAFA